jgi:hypothetical protein
MSFVVYFATLSAFQHTQREIYKNDRRTMNRKIFGRKRC